MSGFKSGSVTPDSVIHCRFLRVRRPEVFRGSPAANSASSVIGDEVREILYGKRSIQTVIECDIGDILRRADRDDYDRYLLHCDAIVC